MNNYSEFRMHTDLVEKLYFHADSPNSGSESEFYTTSKDETEGEELRSKMANEINSHARFDESFFSHTFYYALSNYVCCLKKYLRMC